MKERGSRLTELALEWLATSLVLSVFVIAIPLFSDAPWWIVPVLAALLGLTVMVLEAFKVALKKLTGKWAPYVLTVMWIALAVGYGWAEAGWEWTAGVLIGGLLIQVVWRVAAHLRHARPGRS